MTIAEQLLASPHVYASLPHKLVEQQGETVAAVLTELVAAGRCGNVARRVLIESTEVCLRPVRHRQKGADGRSGSCDLPMHRQVLSGLARTEGYAW